MSIQEAIEAGLRVRIKELKAENKKLREVSGAPELYHFLVEVIAQGLLGYQNIIHSDLKERYIPPSKEDIRYKYQNNPTFNRSVNTVVSHLLNYLKQALEGRK